MQTSLFLYLIPQRRMTNKTSEALNDMWRDGATGTVLEAVQSKYKRMEAALANYIGNSECDENLLDGCGECKYCKAYQAYYFDPLSE